LFFNLPDAVRVRKGVRHDVLDVEGGSHMRRSAHVLGALLSLSAMLTSTAAAQATHIVRLIADKSKDEYRFEPASLTARPNDVIVFRVASGAPHSVVFEGEGLSPGVRGAINNAMPGRSGDLSSPLLAGPGTEYRMVVPQVPPGNYPFYCLPHRAYDMRGELTIK
jgi:plastocyanin